MVNETISNPEINLEKFILFHRNRISLLKELVEKKIHGRLIFQISFLGFESLARVLYMDEKNPSERFIRLLSEAIDKDEATKLYKLWRCALTHQGFITNPWTTLEAWGEEDIEFISFPETNTIKTSVELPPKSIINVYESLIDYFEDFFKKTIKNKYSYVY